MSTLCGQTSGYPVESARSLVEQFESTTIFQFDVAKKIVALHDKGVLQLLEPWLGNEDMHRRGNAAFIFASLGDDRGFQVITAILEDRSAKRAVFIGRPSPGLQIREDRYYAAHLLGDLKDPRAVPILVPLLKDEEVNLIVPWSLGEIGDKSAIPPLIEMLGDSRLEMRAAVLRALEKLEANECRPPLLQIEDGCTIAVNPQRLPVQRQLRSLARLPGVEASTNFGGNLVTRI